ncbi:unnamed protein product [Macrosiphum euphorbiae]|uniref:Uncharacterized protein n=1 Tax=Macrosiphum euphorbiae TaxID=13131 RepID=A0AAV0X7L4_9HEMI|nr:unnamed protein product [Macrosiphum euphorbiae]
MEKKINDNNSSLMHDWSIHAHLKLTQQPNNNLPLSQQPCYGFQRGNIVFTAQPPQRTDSGLGSSSRGSACDCTFNIAPQCEVCCGIRSPMSARRAQSFTAHFCTNVPPKKHLETVDVSSQTSPSTSTVLTKENTNIFIKNRKFELDKHKKRHARTVHIDVYCTESSDSDNTLTSKSTDTLLDLSDVKIKCKKVSKKSHKSRSQSIMSNKSMLQRSPCLSAISSTNTISNSSFYESSSCGLSSFMDSTTLENSSFNSFESENIQKKYQSKNNDDTTSSSSDDECSETAWSFNSIGSQKNQILARRPWSKVKNTNDDMGSFSDCSQSPMYRQPSNSTFVMTQVAKMASKFGPMRSPVKQDHHVGPSKNPDCSCFNCRRYYNTRHRSYSIGSEAGQSEILTLFRKCL